MAGMKENKMSEKGRDTVKVPSGGVKKEEGMVGGTAQGGVNFHIPEGVTDHSQVRSKLKE